MFKIQKDPGTVFERCTATAQFQIVRPLCIFPGDSFTLEDSPETRALFQHQVSHPRLISHEWRIETLRHELTLERQAEYARAREVNRAEALGYLHRKAGLLNYLAGQPFPKNGEQPLFQNVLALCSIEVQGIIIQPGERFAAFGQDNPHLFFNDGRATHPSRSDYEIRVRKSRVIQNSDPSANVAAHRREIRAELETLCHWLQVLDPQHQKAAA